MEWIRGPTIGRGSSATVSLATSAVTGDLFAVKSTDLSSSSMLQREKCAISQFNSPHIVKCLGCDITRESNNDFYNLFLEYVPGGTISDLAKRRRFTEPMIRFYAQQILQGIDYLHSVGFVHCDIKGQNILVSEDYRVVKIADFGCGKFLENRGAPFSGTPAFMAPEVARGEEQHFPADIWAFGCTIIEIATVSVPWRDMIDPVSALFRIANSDDVPEFPRWFSDEAKDFLGKCLQRDANRRSTAAELLRHPFLKKSTFESTAFMDFFRDSPTSVLDNGVWNSVEMSRSTFGSNTAGGFPANRIERLIIETGFPVWDDDDDDEWLMVRGNQENEDNELIDLEPILFSINFNDESSFSSFDFFEDEISVSVSDWENIVMFCDDFAPDEIQNFGKNKFENSISSTIFVFFAKMIIG